MVISAVESTELALETGLRKDQIIISCKVSRPRDLIAIYRDLARKTEQPLHLSIMGCAVNGPGEAHDSQLGITFGRGVGMIFKDGVPMRKVAGENIVEAFVMETEKLLSDLRKSA
jgi:4-hydroxy-3-methylbut-2-en-1-yl diphosphate synthase IspG/GcpE